MYKTSIFISSLEEAKCELDKKKRGIGNCLQVSNNTVLQEQRSFFKKGRIIKNILAGDTSQTDEEICLVGSVEDIKKFLLNNPELRNKTLVLLFKDDESVLGRKEHEFSSKEIDKIADEFSMYPKAKIRVEGHVSSVLITECQKAIKLFESIVDQVQALNLSPLEQLMYVYDIIKEKRYVAETEEDQMTDSRDLTPVLLGDKIVCSGYAMLFKTIIDRLGFKNNIDSSKEKTNEPISKKNIPDGHARNIVYVKDDKYGVEGILSFDTTWDSKKDFTDTNYINRYFYFAETREQASASKRKKKLKTPPKLEEMIQAVENLIATGQWPENVEWCLSNITTQVSLDPEYVTELEELYKLLPIGKDLDEQTAKELIETLQQYNKLYNTQFPATTFLSLVCNVRAKQQQVSLEKHPFSLSILVQCLANSSLELDGIKKDDSQRKNDRLIKAAQMTKDFWRHLEVKPNVVMEGDTVKQAVNQVQHEESKEMNRKK